MKYLKKFNTADDYIAFRRSLDSGLYNHTALVKNTNYSFPQNSLRYFTKDALFYIQALEDLEITYENITSASSYNFSYDGVEWQSWNNSSIKISLKKNEKVYLKPNTSTQSKRTHVVIPKLHRIGGSLVNFCVGQYEYEKDAYQMFMDDTGLVSAADLIIIGQGNNGFLYETFKGCVNLATEPYLIYLKWSNSTGGEAGGPLVGTFEGCTSLTSSPTIYVSFPYNSSTKNYSRLFSGCTKLKKIKYMSLQPLGGELFTDWVKDLPASGTFIMNAAATWEAPFGADAVPEGWTIETAES